MKTSDFYAVAPLAPVNRTAGNVASKGEHFNFRDEPHHFVSHAPPPAVPLPVNPEFVDITGKRVGKLTVVSYAGAKKPNGEDTRWNVRCVCGRYEQRRRKVLNDPSYAEKAACSECDRVARNREFYGVRGAKLREALSAKRSRRVD